MKTLHKRILTICLTLMMAVMLSMPAFASWNKPSHMNLQNLSSNAYLNLEGEGYAYHERPVTRYNWTSSYDQFWRFEYSTIDNAYKLYSYQNDIYGNRGFMLNLVRSDKHCNILQESPAYPDTQDSAVTVQGDISAFHVWPTAWGSNYKLSASSNSGDRRIFFLTGTYHTWNKAL